MNDKNINYIGNGAGFPITLTEVIGEDGTPMVQRTNTEVLFIPTVRYLMMIDLSKTERVLENIEYPVSDPQTINGITFFEKGIDGTIYLGLGTIFSGETQFNTPIYTLDISSLTFSALPNSSLQVWRNFIIDDNGDMLLGTYANGVFKLNNATKTMAQTNLNIGHCSKLLRASDNNIYAAIASGSNVGLYRYNGTSFTKVTLSNRSDYTEVTDLFNSHIGLSYLYIQNLVGNTRNADIYRLDNGVWTLFVGPSTIPNTHTDNMGNPYFTITLLTPAVGVSNSMILVRNTQGRDVYLGGSSGTVGYEVQYLDPEDNQPYVLNGLFSNPSPILEGYRLGGTSDPNYYNIRYTNRPPINRSSASDPPIAGVVIFGGIVYYLYDGGLYIWDRTTNSWSLAIPVSGFTMAYNNLGHVRIVNHKTLSTTISTETNLVRWAIDIGDPNLIKQNLTSLLIYQIGQRIRQENFGTRLWEMIEEPNTQLMAFMIRRFILDGINAWEPRITLIQVQTTQQKELISINLVYEINQTKNIFELDFTYNPLINNSNVSQ